MDNYRGVAKEMSTFFILIIPITIFLCLLIALVSMIEYNHQPTSEEMMDWDFRGCEQMRESGWTETEIKEFMDKTNGYYDKDYI